MLLGSTYGWQNPVGNHFQEQETSKKPAKTIKLLCNYRWKVQFSGFFHCAPLQRNTVEMVGTGHGEYWCKLEEKTSKRVPKSVSQSVSNFKRASIKLPIKFLLKLATWSNFLKHTGRKFRFNFIEFLKVSDYERPSLGNRDIINFYLFLLFVLVLVLTVQFN